jgi:hypothetical protein
MNNVLLSQEFSPSLIMTDFPKSTDKNFGEWIWKGNKGEKLQAQIPAMGFPQNGHFPLATWTSPME